MPSGFHTTLSMTIGAPARDSQVFPKDFFHLRRRAQFSFHIVFFVKAKEIVQLLAFSELVCTRLERDSTSLCPGTALPSFAARSSSRSGVRTSFQSLCGTAGSWPSRQRTDRRTSPSAFCILPPGRRVTATSHNLRIQPSRNSRSAPTAHSIMYATAAQLCAARHHRHPFSVALRLALSDQAAAARSRINSAKSSNSSTVTSQTSKCSSLGCAIRMMTRSNSYSSLNARYAPYA